MDYQGQSFAIINALILAKVVLVAEDLRLGNRFMDHALIYSVLDKSFIFAVALACFHLLEGVIVASLRARPLSESLVDFGRGDLKGIASTGALVFASFIPFFMFREAARVIGVTMEVAAGLTEHVDIQVGRVNGRGALFNSGPAVVGRVRISKSSGVSVSHERNGRVEKRRFTDFDSKRGNLPTPCLSLRQTVRGPAD